MIFDWVMKKNDEAVLAESVFSCTYADSSAPGRECRHGCRGMKRAQIQKRGSIVVEVVVGADICITYKNFRRSGLR